MFIEIAHAAPKRVVDTAGELDEQSDVEAEGGSTLADIEDIEARSPFEEADVRTIQTSLVDWYDSNPSTPAVAEYL